MALSIKLSNGLKAFLALLAANSAGDSFVSYGPGGAAGIGAFCGGEGLTWDSRSANSA